MSNAAMPGVDDCIAQCGHCHEICLRTAMTHCLEAGGEHVAPAHFRLMMACVAICRTSQDVMLMDLAEHAKVCAACAAICRACAQSCDALDGMQECAAACRRCAETCEAMAPTRA